jgi:hypothetical protein
MKESQNFCSVKKYVLLSIENSFLGFASRKGMEKG